MYKYNIRLSLHHKPRANDMRAVRVRVTWFSRRVDVTLSALIPEGVWDADKEKAVNTKTWKDAGVINSEASAVRASVDALFVRCFAEQRIPTIIEVKDAMTGRTATPVLSIEKAIEEFIDDNQVLHSWSVTTPQKFRNLARHLEHAGLSRLEDLNEDGLKAFVEGLNQEGLRNSTILKQIGFLKWFLRWAYNKRYYTDQSFELWKPRLKNPPREVIFLEWEELMRLYEYQFPRSQQHLSSVRDVFCFCAFTGLRYSDAKKLTWADVKADHLRVVTQKTTDPLRIELNRWSSAIIDKYRLLYDGDNTRKVLQAASNQKANDYIKEAAYIVGIDAPVRMVTYYGSERVEYVFKKHEVISTHAARRTFVVNALTLGIPAEVVMKWTGHSSFKAMEPYIAIVDKLKSDNMKKFDKLDD